MGNVMWSYVKKRKWGKRWDRREEQGKRKVEMGDQTSHSTPPHSHYHHHYHLLLPSNPTLLFASVGTSGSLLVAGSLTPETWSPSGSESNNKRLCLWGGDVNIALHGWCPGPALTSAAQHSHSYFPTSSLLS